VNIRFGKQITFTVMSPVEYTKIFRTKFHTFDNIAVKITKYTYATQITPLIWKNTGVI
jgi:hypothetical protein